MTSQLTSRFAVIGNPIDHSLSPRIHSAFAAQLGDAIEYGKLRADDDAFDDVAGRFFRSGGIGMNVTVPFKRVAWDWVDERSSAAELAGAVNTIACRDGVLTGHNTDGVGLVADLRRTLTIGLDGARVLVVGAGGATRGSVGPLLDAGVSQLVVANRTTGNAETLTALFGDPRLSATGLDVAGTFDLVIHATAAVRRGSLPALRPEVLAGAACYDLDYAPALADTAFCRFARRCGANVVADGLGMLIEQAAEAYAIWHGRRPDTDAVRNLLAHELGRSEGAER